MPILAVRKAKGKLTGGIDSIEADYASTQLYENLALWWGRGLSVLWP